MMVRVAMWSAPGDASVELMKAWQRRTDCVVANDPLKAHYLVETGADEPQRRRILDAQEHDWRKVVAWLSGPLPAGRTVFYQHQVAHHLVGNMDLGWLDAVQNCLLIRRPRPLIRELLEQYGDARLRDTGFVQQKRVFDWVRRNSGRPPLVIDRDDLLAAPEAMLHRLCERLGVEFSPEMFLDLIAPESPAQADTIAEADEIPPPWQGLFWQCLELYEEFAAHRLGR